MPLSIIEIFGHTPVSPHLAAVVRSRLCPFVGNLCIKTAKNGMPLAACTAAAVEDPTPVIICPQRLYANHYEILRHVANQAFGSGPPFILDSPPPPDASQFVIAFGKGVGKELRISYRGKHYAVDWVLALVEQAGRVIEFVPVEIQTIDTNGSYHLQVWEIQQANGSPHTANYPRPLEKNSGLNWENVHKRIIPQLIMKGRIVENEPLCKKGLYFICPTPVHNKIQERLGHAMAPYSPRPGAITFHHYSLELQSSVDPRPLILSGDSTTTIEQLSLALTAPRDLPRSGLYGDTIQEAVNDRLQRLA